MGFWREVFDFRDEAQTPARAKAAVQVAAVIAVLGVVAVLTVGIATDWHSPAAISLLSIPICAAGVAASSAVRLRGLRRERRPARATRPPRPPHEDADPERRD